MFAYCGNEPINHSDALGSWPQWGDDAYEWLAGVADDLANWGRRTVIKIRDWANEQKQKEQSGVFSIGIDFAGGYGLSFGGSYGIGIDNRGNIGLIDTKFYGCSFPTASIGGYLSFSSASSIYALAGDSATTGASGNIYLISVGGEVDTFFDKKLNKPVLTGRFLLGLGVSFPIEAHTGISRTNVYSFNIFDTIIMVCDYLT